MIYETVLAILPTVEKAFSKDECGWWGDVLFRSIVDGNVCTPEQYADNWEVVR